MFMVVVHERMRETLIPIIQKYIAPGSIIRSDCWKPYECLSQYGYIHETVNHSKNFKHPETGCHTNSIEGEWQKVKRGITMPRFGVKADHLQGYLSVHTWQQVNKLAVLARASLQACDVSLRKLAMLARANSRQPGSSQACGVSLRKLAS